MDSRRDGAARRGIGCLCNVQAAACGKGLQGNTCQYARRRLRKGAVAYAFRADPPQRGRADTARDERYGRAARVPDMARAEPYAAVSDTDLRCRDAVRAQLAAHAHNTLPRAASGAAVHGDPPLHAEDVPPPVAGGKRCRDAHARCVFRDARCKDLRHRKARGSAV